MATEPSLVYADASALVKLVVDEPETPALREFLEQTAPQLVTSHVALVEVTRAAIVAHPARAARETAERVVRACMLVDVTASLLERAAELADRTLRTLDALHLATALEVEPDVALVYDRRLAEASAAAGLHVLAPIC